MKATEMLLLVLFGCCILFMITTHMSQNGTGTNEYTSAIQNIRNLIRLIELQNQTISSLTRTTSDESSSQISKLLQVIHEKDMQISTLQSTVTQHKEREQQYASQEVSHSSSHSPSSNTYSTPMTSLEQDCDARYGYHLIDAWRSSRQIWCTSPASSLVCYPYHQEHKKLDGRGPDMFCEATNFIIDFSKVSGSPSSHKPQKGSEYLDFAPGSLVSNCRRTDQYREALFMPHHKRQMRSLAVETSVTSDIVIDTPTYLLARDEDCENSFHSTADFMNMLLVMRVLNLSADDMQVVLFDKYPDGPYIDLIKKAYSPKHDVIRHAHYGGKKVMFKRLVFHLESPAGLIFPKVANPTALRCVSTGLFQTYRKFVLQAFDLFDVPPPPIPSITLSLRHRSQHKNVGRVMANEADVVKVLKEINMAQLHVVDTGAMSYYEQLKLIRNTNILVGIHGAGLMLIMFAAEEAILVEIHPSYRQDRHFRHAARMTNKIYMPLRATARETCVGTSDNVIVPIDEFRKTMDGAVRIARSFDDGIAECGLVCPGGILALDKSVNNYYKPGERTQPVNTRFPCGR